MGIELSEHQLAQFKLYYELLVEWNEKMNLTAITDQEEVYFKTLLRFIDCFFSFRFLTTINGLRCRCRSGLSFDSFKNRIPASANDHC